MFTGIITEQGTVTKAAVDAGGNSAVLVIDAPNTSSGLPVGGSVAVNGVCLTATTVDAGEVHLDVMGETLNRSTIGQLSAGDSVNLERCVPAGGRLDGHVVQGHVDGIGVLRERERQEHWERLRFTMPEGLARYVAEKGSIAVDGVSLTVTAVSGANADTPWFEVGLIPTTLTGTGLGATAEGATVNLEVDVLAKYTERLLTFTGPGRQA